MNKEPNYRNVVIPKEDRVNGIGFNASLLHLLRERQPRVNWLENVENMFDDIGSILAAILWHLFTVSKS